MDSHCSAARARDVRPQSMTIHLFIHVAADIDLTDIAITIAVLAGRRQLRPPHGR
jgi:hypothetical protein